MKSRRTKCGSGFNQCMSVKQSLGGLRLAWLEGLIIVILLVPNFGPIVRAAAPTVLFRTGFEASEGYDSKFTLVGQNNWIGEGTGGNGIVADPEAGQLAYIGLWAPTNNDDVLSVWRPINLNPIPSNQTLITFGVALQIVNSTNQEYDDFRWSVYNSAGDRLFTLDFDNAGLQISYGLDDGGGFVSTGFGFDNNGFYDLVIRMNFARNTWTATLNDEVIVNSKPITTKGAALNLGDIDAVWLIRKPGSPGNNYMLFDDYSIVAEGSSSIAPKLETRGFAADGTFSVRVLGEAGLSYAIEGSVDLQTWQTLKTITAPASGIFDYSDAEASRTQPRFYRVRQQPSSP